MKNPLLYFIQTLGRDKPSNATTLFYIPRAMWNNDVIASRPRCLSQQKPNASSILVPTYDTAYKRLLVVGKSSP